MKVNGEEVIHPRKYGGSVFEMFRGSDMFAFRQHTTHGGAPVARGSHLSNTTILAIFYPLSQFCEIGISLLSL